MEMHKLKTLIEACMFPVYTRPCKVQYFKRQVEHLSVHIMHNTLVRSVTGF